ncbi:M20 family metallo-hydrolase [Carboxylicivirga sp. M1479]|uniref:M20 family metallo-hydrolase n=1 Tax=Carboxylicivirga sp. M1479 TaxID=2594476 RepID=UPI001178CA2B|nr:M20 family metallo-hydrolase [Carboxylicivirga sp. M1479]TRX72266.1 M20/M25/M40 family metallo-hydrolase [Carboxylicivirga sp. M1479]
MTKQEKYTLEAIELLKQMIEIQSFSKEEDEVVDLMQNYLLSKELDVQRQGNNLWVYAAQRNDAKPTILLNSHLDTVRPSDKWKYNPFAATLEGDKLTGLGSNDAGGPLVALMAAFLCLKDEELPYNLVFAATAEEEISGASGVASVLDEIGTIDLGIVGEPTQMQMAVAEKGLMVLDCEAHGKTGHAARDEGDNALYKAMGDIEWFKNYQFDKVSPHLGPVKMTVTQVEAGSQHNVVPDSCRFVVDVRLNECYSNTELHQIIEQYVKCDVKPRSFRLNSSYISMEHPFVLKGIELGLTAYGSPTTSDQAVMNFTTIKMGCGDSARSHTPDEYIYLSEIKEGVGIYLNILKGLILITS